VSADNVISIELHKMSTGRTAAYLAGRQIVKPCWHVQLETAKALKAARVFEGSEIRFKRSGDGAPIRYCRLDKLLQEAAA
jgi:hypothetical protein